MLGVGLLALAIADQGWTLEYERSGYVRTGRYAEAVTYCEQLAKASPYARVVRFGTSPEGREMVALLISKERKFKEDEVRKSRKPFVFVLNGIHSGEIEGKDASLILARNLLVMGKEDKILEGANLLIVPVFSVDAHERFGRYNRINQNGPEEMGWRATAQNLNLNRDFAKVDSPEMEALQKLLARYKPDLFFDNHTTNGGDWQYVVGLGVATDPTLDPGVAAWSSRMYESVRGKNDQAGFLTSKYFSLVDPADPAKGIRVGAFGPRFSTGFLTALNRPSILVETHVLKPYRLRVEATYAVMKHAIEHAIDTGFQLKDLLAKADELERSRGEGAVEVLTVGDALPPKPFVFKGYEYAPYASPVSGGMIRKWNREKPIEVASQATEDYEPGLSKVAPAAYALDRVWTEAIRRLRLGHFEVLTLDEDFEGEFETHQLEEVRFPTAPFEGRFQPSFKAVPIREKRRLNKGAVVVRTDQVGRKLLMHLMEPDAPDSLLRWGFFNAVFEQKEYAEPYALEPIAQKMLESDPKLKAEFELRLKDPQFAGSASARLEFFYQRSPYYDVRLRKDPVVRLGREHLARMKFKR